MKLSSSGIKFRLFLKSRIFRQGSNYSDVAKFLNVSLPTVNRILNSEDISLERIIKISEFLNTNVEELFADFSQFKGDPYTLSLEQEDHFLNNPRDLYLLILLNTRKSLESVAEKMGWNKDQVRAGLLRLAKKGLVEVLSNEKYRCLAKIPLSPTKEGLLVSKFLPRFAKILFERFQRSNYEFRKNENSFFSTFEMYLSPRNAKSFKSELQALLKEYRERSQVDCSSSNYPDCKPYAGLLVLENIDLWNEVTADLQKNSNENYSKDFQL